MHNTKKYSLKPKMNLIKIRYLRPMNKGYQLINAVWFMRDTMKILMHCVNTDFQAN